jgi:hypothetical protein
VLEGVRVYNFNREPPVCPRLYLTERHVVELAMYGFLACPYTPPLWTVFPSDGQLGWWKLRFDDTPRGLHGLVDNPDWRKLLSEQLAGMHIIYQNFDTKRSWIWVLTDQVLCRDNDNDLRYAVWPD